MSNKLRAKKPASKPARVERVEAHADEGPATALMEVAIAMALRGDRESLEVAEILEATWLAVVRQKTSSVLDRSRGVTSHRVERVERELPNRAEAFDSLLQSARQIIRSRDEHVPDLRFHGRPSRSWKGRSMPDIGELVERTTAFLEAAKRPGRPDSKYARPGSRGPDWKVAALLDLVDFARQQKFGTNRAAASFLPDATSEARRFVKWEHGKLRSDDEVRRRAVVFILVSAGLTENAAYAVLRRFGEWERSAK